MVAKMDGAIVVLYNPEEDDLKNIEDYANKVNITLILDNSLENNLEKINKHVDVDMKSIIYWHFDENIGLSKAMNKGLNYLKDNGCDWALTMDFDSSFNNNILDVYREYIKKHNCNDVAILAPQFNYSRHPATSKKTYTQRSWVMLSGNYHNLQIFSKMGGFLEDLFVDGLDIEYGLRVNKKGYKIVECGQAILNHKPGTEYNVKFFNHTMFRYGKHSPKRYYYQAESLAFIIKNYRTLHEIELYLWKFSKIFLFFDNKKMYIKEFIKGTRSGLKIKYNKNR